MHRMEARAASACIDPEWTVDHESIFRRQQFGQTIGFGTHPALLIVDFVVGFSDPAIFGGGNIGAAIEQTRGLLDAARRSALPVVLTRIAYAEDGSDVGLQGLKVPQLRRLTEASPIAQFVPALAPRPDEIAISRKLPSAFFGTGLNDILQARGVDTVLIAGCTTSGCVRASALDAMCYGFIPIVVSDCVGDRAPEQHAASLFDLGQKYADLMTSDQVIGRLERLSASPTKSDDRSGKGSTGAARKCQRALPMSSE